MTNLAEKLKQYGFPEPDSFTGEKGFQIAHWHFKGGHTALTHFTDPDKNYFEYTMDYGDLLFDEFVDDTGGNSHGRNADFASVCAFIKFLKGE